MELSDFAKNILLTGSFEQKLSAPKEFSDEKPGGLFETPDQPSRSQALRFHQDESGHSRLTFPSAGSLKSNEARAKVFHAFANHELLAMELMALAILKFPEAPKPFRMGLARCLMEEQEHLKLYLARMRELGVEFGSFPVNGFFWKVLREMKSPIDFITGMSLTFEQANLDFSFQYMTLFKEIGDDASSSIMERVLREEIGHVKFGVQWFEKWRPATETQWKFYCANLTLPLTPQRAKGATFDPKHRAGTGLDSDFLEKLEAYSHSKGRPPRVFIFNSNCELEWAAHLKNQSTFQAPKFQEEIASDLASLMMFLGHKEDIVALPVPPSLPIIRQWREWGFSTPNFIPYSTKNPDALVKELQTFTVKSLDPWGWSPVIAEELAPFETSLLRPSKEWPPLTPSLWNPIAACYQKTSVPGLLKACLAAHPEWNEVVCPPTHLGRVCATLEETLQETEKLFKQGAQPVVLKAPFGSSGFNMIRILALPADAQQLGWIKNVLENQGNLVVEPWLDRVADFSMQIEVEKSVRYLGLTRMISDNRGQYGGHQLGAKLDDLTPETRTLFYQGNPKHPSLRTVLESSAEYVGEWLLKQGFQGAAGIDAFLYRSKDTGQLRVKPIVEVNARFTMGRIALKLEEHLGTGASGVWIHTSKQRLAKLGFNDWTSWLAELNQQIPTDLMRVSPEVVRLKSGVFPTNDPSTARSFLSVLLVNEDVHFLRKLG